MSENGIFLAGTAGQRLSDIVITDAQLDLVAVSSWPGGAQDYRPGVRGLERRGWTAPLWAEQAQGVELGRVKASAGPCVARWCMQCRQGFWGGGALALCTGGTLEGPLSRPGARAGWLGGADGLVTHASKAVRCHLPSAIRQTPIHACHSLLLPSPVARRAEKNGQGSSPRPPTGLPAWQVRYHTPFRPDWRLDPYLAAGTVENVSLRHFEIEVEGRQRAHSSDARCCSACTA